MDNLTTLKGLGNQIVNLASTIDLCKRNIPATVDYTASHETLAAMQQALDFMVNLNAEIDAQADAMQNAAENAQEGGE